jgi:hypothetical protein
MKFQFSSLSLSTAIPEVSMKKVFLPLLLLFIVGATQVLDAQTADSPAMAVSGGLALNMPIGDFATSHGLGLGLDGMFWYEFDPGLWITGRVGYHYFTKKEKESEKSGLMYKTGRTYMAIPIAAGARYYIGKGNIIPYVGGELGLFIMSTTFSETKILANITKETTSSGNEFGLVPMFGLLFPINPTMKLDAHLSYTWIFGYAESTQPIYTSYLGLNVGLIFPLP